MNKVNSPVWWRGCTAINSGFGAVWVQWCPEGRTAELWRGGGCAVVPWILGDAGDTLNATGVTAVTAKEQALL